MASLLCRNNRGSSKGDSKCDTFINLIDLLRRKSLMNVRLRFLLKCRISRIRLVKDQNHPKSERIRLIVIVRQQRDKIFVAKTNLTVILFIEIFIENIAK